MWIKKTWWGNPDLNLEAAEKIFINPFNSRKVPVWVFGLPGDYSFCVHAGASSDYSYTGCFYPNMYNSLEEIMALVDQHHKDKKLFK